MRRSLDNDGTHQGDQHSERSSSDEEKEASNFNFKRSRYTKRSDSDASNGVDVADGGSSKYHLIAGRHQMITRTIINPSAVVNDLKSDSVGIDQPQPLNSSSTTTVHHHASNGIKAIPCSVITRKDSSDANGAKLNNMPTSPILQSSSTSAPERNQKSTSVINGGSGSRITTVSGGISYLSSAKEIMVKMGFETRTGLGAAMREEVDVVVSPEVVGQLEKLLADANVEVPKETVSFNEELILEENVRWIKPVLPTHEVDYATLMQWKRVGLRKNATPEEIIFIEPKSFNDVLALRKCLGVLNNAQYSTIRGNCNPFESLGKGPFLSRAGLKLANLDAALSYALTQPTTNSSDKQSVVGPNELFYFADVCAGPGGFTEYILHKKKWECKGFGMTLKGSLDFDLWSSTITSAENFEPFYGPAGDGDVYNPNNTTAFLNYIKLATEGRGVHLMVADGGFDVEEKELQEIMSKQIYLAQCCLALAVVRPGGMFVCKLFDVLTPFTVGLIYLMYLSFDLIAIHKPNTSRPANSERYLICKWKKQDNEIGGIVNYLASCHVAFWKMKLQNDGEATESKMQDILELVPLDVLKKNKEFFDYILLSNTRLAKQQAENLKRIVQCVRDPTLKDPRQAQLRQTLFDMWRIPTGNNFKAHSEVRGPDVVLKEILGANTTAEFVSCPEYSLLEHNIEAFIRSPFDWRIVVVGGLPQEYTRSFYLSLGRDKIYQYKSKTWSRIQEPLELSKNTLVYGEFVDEVHGKKPNQRIVRSFHIIDAMMLGGTDVRSKHYTARLELCIKFAKSMNKPTNTELCQVRAKVPVRMENIGDVFDRLETRIVSGCGAGSQLVCPVDHTDETLPFIQPAGILFLKITKDPWTMALSRSSNRKYYFNLTTGVSSYDLVLESISEFEYTMQHRMIWWWDRELKGILSTHEVTDTNRPIATSQGVLNPQKLLQYINGAWQANRTAVMRRLSSSSSSQGSS